MSFKVHGKVRHAHQVSASASRSAAGRPRKPWSTLAPEFRVLEIEVNPKLRTQVRMPIGDHVDPFDGRDLLDILQASSDSIDGHMMMFSLAHGAYSVA